VRFIAKPRAPGSAHHAAVGKYCEEQLKKSGYQVSRQAFTSGENILAEKAGKAARTVVLSAHYDHIPYCDGADDNATGVAVVLEAARVLAPLSFDNRLVLACWDDEEAGLNGSAAYASRALERSEDIALAIALDGVGFTNSAPNSQTVPPGFDRLFPEMKARLDALGGRATFAAVLGDTAAAAGIAALERHAAAAKLPLISAALGTLQRLALLDAARSDHASFWLQGFPALLISDTANFRNPRYHCGEGQDDVQSLDFAFTTAIAQTVAGAVAQLLASGTPSP
jgi:Zn-dependent M28 family amino/carboxypeptidase